MDHVTVAADPMTYFAFNGRHYFQNVAAQCGSDCVSGKAPNTGEICDGRTARTIPAAARRAGRSRRIRSR